MNPVARTNQAKMGYVPVSGKGKIYYEEKGEGEPLILLPDCGHMMNMEQPETFNRAVLQFLDGIK